MDAPVCVAVPGVARDVEPRRDGERSVAEQISGEGPAHAPQCK